MEYDIYTVPNPEDNVTALAERMLSVTDLKKLIKEANGGNEHPVVEDIDIKDLRYMLDDLSYANCKIVLIGKDLLEREILDDQDMSKSNREKEML